MSDNNFNLPQEEFSFEKVFNVLWRNLWLIIICMSLAIGLAFIYNKYSVPVYKVATSILIKENNSQPFSSGADNMFGSNLFGGNQNLQNELIIIQSSPTVKKTIQNLDLEVEYYEYKNHQYYDNYNSSPFEVILFKEHPQILGKMFDIHFNADGSFNLIVEEGNVNLYNYAEGKRIGVKNEFELNLKANLGQIVESEYFKFIVQLSDDNFSDFNDDKHFSFKLTNNKLLTRKYLNKLKFSIVDENSTVIEISLLTTSIERGRDVLDELTKVYSRSNLEEKNHIANMTINYIEQQLKDVSKTLILAEDSLQRFLSKNQLVDVENQAAGMSEQLLNLQNSLAELLTQKRYFNYVFEYLESNNEETQIIAPSSMGIQDPLLNKLIMDLSTAQSTRANLIQNGQERNPIVQRLGIQIDNLKSVVAENIASSKKSNELSVEEMQKRIAQLEFELRKLPKTQLQLGGIQRSFKLNDAIYNYLLQKHAEAKITKASNLPDNIVVAPADLAGGGLVSPNKSRNYLLSIILGGGLPFGFLMILLMFKQKIETREDLEKITNAPILGTILHSKSKDEANVFKNRPQSNIAESYRTLRTNLNFYLGNKEVKTILFTSTVSGEGKSFTSLNVAASYAGLGYKTILVNCDIRKATKVIKVDDSKVGLSTFLSGKSTMDQIISKTDIENLSYVAPGPIPPNPMELIASTKTSLLMEYLKGKYQCIILDGTPLAQVTDSFNLVQFSDVSVIITRFKYTNKKILKLVLKDLKQKKVENVVLVLNDNRIASEQYGYGYGYYEK